MDDLQAQEARRIARELNANKGFMMILDLASEAELEVSEAAAKTARFIRKVAETGDIDAGE